MADELPVPEELCLAVLEVRADALEVRETVEELVPETVPKLLFDTFADNEEDWLGAAERLP